MRNYTKELEEASFWGSKGLIQRGIRYFYIAQKFPDGLVKFGFSGNPERRIRQFGHNTPGGTFAMDLIEMRDIPPTRGMIDDEYNPYAYPELNARIIEKRFLRKFKEFCIRGEWFNEECLPASVNYLKNMDFSVYRARYVGRNGSIISVDRIVEKKS